MIRKQTADVTCEHDEQPENGADLPRNGLLASVAEGWNRRPVTFTEPGLQRSLSAALWIDTGGGTSEVSRPVFTDTHVISIQQSDNCVAELRKDGRLVSATSFARRGSAQMMPAGVRPAAVYRGAWRVLHLYLPTATIDQIIKEERSDGDTAIEWIDPFGSYDGVLDRIGAETLSEMRQRSSLSRLRIDVLGLELAIHLLRTHSNFGRVTRHRADMARDWRLRRACELIESRLGDDLGLREIAAAVGVSQRHLTSIFRTGLGHAPHQWLLKRRLERGGELLAKPGQSITEIALSMGFASAQHFSTAFRARTGVTPSQYRRDRLA